MEGRPAVEHAHGEGVREEDKGSEQPYTGVVRCMVMWSTGYNPRDMSCQKELSCEGIVRVVRVAWSRRRGDICRASAATNRRRISAPALRHQAQYGIRAVARLIIEQLMIRYGTSRMYTIQNTVCESGYDTKSKRVSQ